MACPVLQKPELAIRIHVTSSLPRGTMEIIGGSLWVQASTFFLSHTTWGSDKKMANKSLQKPHM